MGAAVPGVSRMKICMLSTVHAASDVRIFEKETRCLADAGFSIIVIANPPGFSKTSNMRCHLLDFPKKLPRWKRPFVAGYAAFKLVLEIKPDVVHFHDPEFIPFAVFLKRRGIKVIYDAHEDTPSDVLSKQWIPSWLRPLVAISMAVLERWASRKFETIVVATPRIGDRFRSYGAEVKVVRNYPRLEDFLQNPLRKRQAIYVGRISFDRGLIEMCEACAEIGLPLVLVGHAGLMETAWLNRCLYDVKWLGVLKREQVVPLLKQSLVGLCVLHPEPNYQYALPIKLFEYMAGGLPVITTDLPIASQIVEDAQCGVVVKAGDKQNLIAALRLIDTDQNLVVRQRVAGLKAVSSKYNWAQESKILIELYQGIAMRVQL